MARAIEEMIKQDKLEKEILKKLNIILNGLYETYDIEEVNDEYVLLETDVNTKGYEVYLKNEQILFAKPLNAENDFGRIIYIADELSADEYDFLLEKNKKQNNFIVYKVISYLILFISCFGSILYLVEQIKEGTDLMNTLSLLVWSYFPAIILSLLLLVNCKKNK